MGNGSATQYYNEALRQTKRKNWNKALEFLNKAIAKDSKHVKSYNALGMVCARKGDSNAARRYWLKALKIDAHDVTAKQCLEGLGKRNISTRIRVLLRPAAFAIVLAALITAYSFAWIRHTRELRNEMEQLRAMAYRTENLQSDLDSPHQRTEEQDGTGQSNDAEFVRQDKVDQRHQQSPRAELEAHVSSPITPPEIAQAYTQAYNDCVSRKYDSAIKTFRQILEYPSWHELKDNAQYWLAECYYAKGESVRALTEFQKVKKHFPKGNKVFDSELKVAYAYLRLDRVEQASQKILQLSRDFPDERYQSSIATLSEKIRLSRSNDQAALSGLVTETY